MDNAIFDKAQSIMTSRRMKAVSENEQRIAEVNQKIPQIREINEVLFNTGKELISIISNGRGEDVSQKVEQLKQYNLGAQAMSRKILAEAGIEPTKRVKDFTEEDEAKIREIIDRDYTVEGDLRKEVSLNIKRLMEINCYRGQRHKRRLPVRGQRTKTNARTRKGPRKTIAGKKGV